MPLVLVFFLSRCWCGRNSFHTLPSAECLPFNYNITLTVVTTTTGPSNATTINNIAPVNSRTILTMSSFDSVLSLLTVNSTTGGECYHIL